MSDENDTQNDTEGIKNLRKQFETQGKQLQEALDTLSGYQAKDRQSSVATVLKAKGLNEKAASLYTGDDVSEEAVGKWVEDFADVFGVKPSTEQAPAGDAEAQSILRIQQLANGAADPISNVPAGQVIPVGDPAAMLRAMNTLPYDKLVEMGYMPDVKGTLYDNHGRS